MGAHPARRVLAALALTAWTALACAEPGPQRPNLLLITVDTLRPDQLACYGGPRDVGRALCAIADDGGTRYVWALSTASSTAPAVASILTSRYPSGHGVRQFATSQLADGVHTLAEQLSSAGYTTAAFVCNPVLHRSRRFDRGFEVYDAHMTRRERNRPELREREARAATDDALAWLRVVAEDGPWFLWIHYQDPHGPYEPPNAAPIVDPAGGTRLTLLADHSGRNGIPAYQALPGLYAVESYRQRYLDEIRHLDRQLERLIAGVDRLGDPPAILLTADHGEAFGEDGYWFAHGHSLGLEQVRVPLLWRPPGSRSDGGGVVPTPVSLLDVAPTLLAAAGVPVPPAFEGQTLPSVDDLSSRLREDRQLFVEHPLRAAVARGRIYYERDRRALDEPEIDPISGGRLTGMRPRRSRLPIDGRAPAALPTGRDPQAEAELERLLSDFLARPSDAAADEAAAEVSREHQEGLRALGYLE